MVDWHHEGTLNNIVTTLIMDPSEVKCIAMNYGYAKLRLVAMKVYEAVGHAEECDGESYCDTQTCQLLPTAYCKPRPAPVPTMIFSAKRSLFEYNAMYSGLMTSVAGQFDHYPRLVASDTYTGVIQPVDISDKIALTGYDVEPAGGSLTLGTQGSFTAFIMLSSNSTDIASFTLNIFETIKLAYASNSFKLTHIKSKFKYYKWTPTGYASGSSQPRVSEFEFFEGDTKIWGHNSESTTIEITGATNGNEANLLYDGDVSGTYNRVYWSSTATNIYFVFTLSEPKTATKFRFGNNANNQWVALWKLEGSNDKASWTELIDVQSNVAPYKNTGNSYKWATYISATDDDNYFPIVPVETVIVMPFVLDPLKETYIALVFDENHVTLYATNEGNASLTSSAQLAYSAPSVVSLSEIHISTFEFITVASVHTDKALTAPEIELQFNFQDIYGAGALFRFAFLLFL